MEYISTLFHYNNGKMKLIDIHAKLRNMYYKYWFLKCFFKVRRRTYRRKS